MALVRSSDSSSLLFPVGKTSESENKSRVTAIHNLKEKLKQETEKLKQLKQQLSEIEQKQQLEKEVRVIFLFSPFILYPHSPFAYH